MERGWYEEMNPKQAIGLTAQGFINIYLHTDGSQKLFLFLHLGMGLGRVHFLLPFHHHSPSFRRNATHNVFAPSPRCPGHGCGQCVRRARHARLHDVLLFYVCHEPRRPLRSPLLCRLPAGPFLTTSGVGNGGLMQM